MVEEDKGSGEENKETPGIPEALKGKSPEEVAILYGLLEGEKELAQKNYKEVESLMGRQTNELGRLRKEEETRKQSGEFNAPNEEIKQIEEELSLLGIEKNKLEKLVKIFTNPLSRQVSELQGLVQSQILISEIPELKDLAVQKRVLDKLEAEGVAPTLWTIRQAYKEMNALPEDKIRKEERGRVMDELKKKDLLLPESPTVNRDTPENMGDRIVRAGGVSKVFPV
jgi:DNA repair exonuclease SbcCD ATPase subunit